LRDFNYFMQRMCYRNKDGSHATQANRKRILDQIATRLHELGYRNMKPQSLKSKHIEALVKDWKEQNITDATIPKLIMPFGTKAGKVDVVVKVCDMYWTCVLDNSISILLKKPHLKKGE